MTPVFAQTDMGSVIVAVFLILLVGVIMITAMFKYPTIEDILKLWAGLGTLVGLVAGTMGTYFFTKDATERIIANVQAEKEAIVANVEAEKTSLIAEKSSEVESHSGTKTALARSEREIQELREEVALRTPVVGQVRIYDASAPSAVNYTWMPAEFSLADAVRANALEEWARARILTLIGDEKEREEFTMAVETTLRLPAPGRYELLFGLLKAAEQKQPNERASALLDIETKLAALQDETTVPD